MCMTVIDQKPEMWTSSSRAAALHTHRSVLDLSSERTTDRLNMRYVMRHTVFKHINTNTLCLYRFCFTIAQRNSFAVRQGTVVSIRVQESTDTNINREVYLLMDDMNR